LIYVYKLNYIYSQKQNLTMASSSFNLGSKIIHNILMLPILIKSFLNALILFADTTQLGKL